MPRRKQPATTVLDLPLDQITEQDGLNPRGEVAPADVGELAASIKDRGVLQPIRVRALSNGDAGAYVLVAGKRRVAAARLAGLGTIPAVVAADGDDQDDALDALIENVQREDLSPLEEARALDAVRERLPAKQRSGRKLAERIKRSDDWVSDRLRLLTLPDTVAAAIDTGAVGLHAMPALSRIAASGPGGADLAAELANRVVEGTIERRELEDPGDLSDAIAQVAHATHDGTHHPPIGAVQVTANGHSGYRLDALPIDDAVKDELRDRWNALPCSSAYYSRDPGQKRTCAFGPDDADAAKAYGCLLEIEAPHYAGSNYTHRYITDAVFIADRVRLWLDRAEKEAKKRAAKDKETKAQREARESREADQAERAEHEQEEQRRRNAAALAANDDLARTTAEALRKVKPDDRVVTLICFAALEGLGWNRLAASGLRFADDQLREVNPAKGTAKYASEDRCGERLRELFDEASTPAEVLGVTVRAIVLAQHADDGAKGQSWTYPLPGANGTGTAAIFPALVDEVAFRAEALTPALKEAAIATAARRDAAAEREQRRAEETRNLHDRAVVELMAGNGTEKTTPAELVKLIQARAQDPGDTKVAEYVPHLSAGLAKEAIARVEAVGQIELASDGEYYITNAGIAAHAANVAWWRTEGREQAFYAGYEDPADVEREEGPEAAAEFRAELEDELTRAREMWAEEDAAAATPPPTIVHVEAGRDRPGEVLEAELQPDRQAGRPNVRKVIYTESRTAAWVAVKRITDLPAEDAAAGGTEVPA